MSNTRIQVRKFKTLKVLSLKLCRGELKVRAPILPIPRRRVKGTYHFKEDHPLWDPSNGWRIYIIPEALLLYICTYLSPYWGAYNRGVVGELQRRAAIQQASLEDQYAFEHKDTVRYVKMPVHVKTLKQELKPIGSSGVTGFAGHGGSRVTGFAGQEMTISPPTPIRPGAIQAGKFTGYRFIHDQILLGPIYKKSIIDCRSDIIYFKHSRYKITYNTQYSNQSPSIQISLKEGWSTDINSSPINSSKGKAFIQKYKLERFFDGYLDREPDEVLDYIADRTAVIEYSPDLTTCVYRSAQEAAEYEYSETVGDILWVKQWAPELVPRVMDRIQGTIESWIPN
jgi:hypothetical protein